MGQQAANMPRAVRKGPLITLTCECGQRRELHYGDVWKCEKCGKTWNTNRIPLDQYAAIRRTQLRYRLIPLISGLVLLVAVIVFWATGKAYGAIIAVPFLAASYVMFGRPFFRSRYRKSLSKNLPTWEIPPE
jgi:hypothetical protein